MLDPYTNARPYLDVVFPSSGDGFSIAGFKNVHQALAFLDMIPLQPRAHSPGDMRVMIRGRDAASFYNPVYTGDANQRIGFASGDTTTMTAPSANPRIDVVYLTPSGDLRIITGTEAATPTLPTLAPSGDTRLPICAIYHKTTATKIVNYEDKDSNTGDSYIYQDLRPWLQPPRPWPPVLISTTKIATLGDAAVIRTDASQGNLFRVTLGGNRTLQKPTNPVDGQKVIWEFLQDGTGSRTLTLGAGFKLSATVGAVTLSTGANSGDKLGAIFNSADDLWHIVAFVKGF